MRDIKYLKINSEKLANSIKERSLFRNQRKAVNAGANGTLEYTIKEGVNKSKIADSMLIKNKKSIASKNQIMDCRKKHTVFVY